VPADGPPSSFWVREAGHIKQGLKTGTAGLIAYAIYVTFHLPEGYWAVFTALLVTQANLGASWKAALYRTAGSTVGALSAALLAPVIGTGPVRTGVTLFLLAALFAYLTTLHPSFSAAGFTAALVLLLGATVQPWHLAWLRVLYTILGAVIAFGVGILLWPVRAREGLRSKIADFLEDFGRLYRAVTTAALQETCDEGGLEPLRTTLRDDWLKIATALEESRSEPSFNRFNHEGYVALLEELDHLRQRLLAMCRDSSSSSHAGVLSTLVPELEPLAEGTAQALLGLAAAVRTQSKGFDLGPLDNAVETVDRRLQHLRDTQATSPVSLDRMLPFWSFLFNLKEVVAGVKSLNAKLARLS